MNELIVFPDPVVITMAALADGLTTAGYPDVDVYGTVADPRPVRFVRILRIGGVRDGIVIDDAMLTVEAWAESDYESHALAQAARAVINAAAGSAVAGVAIYTVTEMSGPVNLPDPESDQSRHTWTVEISCRGAAV